MTTKIKPAKAAAMHPPEANLQLYLEPEHISLMVSKKLMANMDQAQL